MLDIKYIRENNIPFFGICLGMQCCVVEFARHVLGLEGASSTEVELHTPHPVIDLMPEQKQIVAKGVYKNGKPFNGTFIERKDERSDNYELINVVNFKKTGFVLLLLVIIP